MNPNEEEDYDRGLINRVCCLCGIALYNLEVGAEIEGVAVDYNTREHAEVSLTFCTDCWEKIKEILIGGLRPAVAKRRALESLTKEDERGIEDT